MPRRPDSHRTGDTAVNQILEICYSLGWACDRVQDDYGEDIIVQTTLKNEIDPYRILIQSKGTENIRRYKKKGGSYSYPFRTDTLRKWVRSKNLVIVILWDIKQNYGLWAVPQTDVDEWQLLKSTKQLALSFSEENVFNKEQAEKLAWNARVNHYNGLLLESVDFDDQAEEFADSDDNTPVESRTGLIAFDFLRRIGVATVKADGHIIMDGQFLDWFQDYCKDLSREVDVSDQESAMMVMHQAGMLAFTRYFEQLTMVGAPRELIIRCGSEATKLIMILVQSTQKQ